MQDINDGIIWFNRALFVSLALFAILAAILPLGLYADALIMPDILMAMTFAWVIRRPETAPYVLVFLMALFADVMLMRPLGLWAMLTLLTAEFARSQRKPLREQMFVMEWVIFGFVFAIAVGASMMMLKLTFTPGPSVDLMLNHMVSTILIYPPVAGILHFVFRIRAPRDAARPDRLGRVA